MSLCGHCQAAIPADAERCPECGHAAGELGDELLGRELLGRYRIVRLIAEGGMGRVYVAEQAVGTAVRQVAVKVLRRQLGADPQLATRFAREAETLVRLTHPNTVQLFDFGALPDGTLALVMEYVRGHSLTAELARGPLTLGRVQRILTQICGALKEAHGHGIVHRDLKPDNVLIADREGHSDFVKVLDFGIARVSELEDPKRTKLTQQGMMIGTPPYMSPEQFMGERVDARSDIYSLGLITYELLSGRLPFEANTPWEWASKHMTAAPAPLPVLNDGSLPRGQAQAIERALAKKAADRPATVDEFLDAFFAADVAAGTTSAASGRDGSSKRPDSGSHQRPVVATSPTDTSDDESELASPRRTWSGRPAMLAMLVAALGLVALGLLASRPSSAAKRTESPGSSSRAALVGSPPSLPHAGPASASSLPSGVSIPEPATGSGIAPGARSSGERPRSRHRAEVHDESSRPGGTANVETPVRAPVPAQVEQHELPTSETHAAKSEPTSVSSSAAAPKPSTSSAPSKAASAPASSPSKPAQAPRDLVDRVTAIRSALTRPEVAVGLYQAAAARYEAHPLLREVRAQLSDQAAKRVQELISGGRCAQAQALHRALRSIGAASSTAKLSTSRCTLP